MEALIPCTPMLPKPDTPTPVEPVVAPYTPTPLIALLRPKTPKAEPAPLVSPNPPWPDTLVPQTPALVLLPPNTPALELLFAITPTPPLALFATMASALTVPAVKLPDPSRLT